MKHYVFYDPRTGRVLHTHAVVGADGRDIEVSADQLSRMVSRFVDVNTASWLHTTITPISSRAAEQWVDLDTGELTVRRIERPADRAERRKQHRRTDL